MMCQFDTCNVLHGALYNVKEVSIHEDEREEEDEGVSGEGPMRPKPE